MNLDRLINQISAKLMESNRDYVTGRSHYQQWECSHLAMHRAALLQNGDIDLCWIKEFQNSEHCVGQVRSHRSSQHNRTPFCNVVQAKWHLVYMGHDLCFEVSTNSRGLVIRSVDELSGKEMVHPYQAWLLETFSAVVIELDAVLRMNCI